MILEKLSDHVGRSGGVRVVQTATVYRRCSYRI